MEFKNFENKLIVEKITNYCIENNISTQKINALTAKIKFGKLNEAFGLNTLGKGIRAIGDFADYAGITSAGRYKKSIGLVQGNLQKAMDYLKAVNDDLNPINGDNIFDKNKVSLDAAKKAELQNAVSQLKDAIDQYSPVVANSLKQIGGQISGASNYGEEQSFDFNEMFPELKTGGPLAQAFTTAYTTAGTPFPSDKQADLNRILLQSRQNILKTFKVLDASKHGEFIQKIKDTVANVITKFGTPATVADGYALLNTIVSGTHNPTQAKRGLEDNTIKSLIKNNGNLHDVYKTALVSTANLLKLRPIFEKIYDGKNNAKISALIMQAVNATPKASARLTITSAENDVLDDLMSHLENFISHA